MTARHRSVRASLLGPPPPFQKKKKMMHCKFKETEPCLILIHDGEHNPINPKPCDIAGALWRNAAAFPTWFRLNVSRFHVDILHAFIWFTLVLWFTSEYERLFPSYKPLLRRFFFSCLDLRVKLLATSTRWRRQRTSHQATVWPRVNNCLGMGGGDARFKLFLATPSWSLLENSTWCEGSVVL